MHLSRPTGPRAAISLVAMIDVLMILLVFFMVTSTYLDLDMVPLAGADDSAAAPVVPQTPPMRLLVRLGAEGAAHVRGQVVDA
ncbi:MAG: biopolymer transporter ExbD, partial [Rhodobacterales bacterium]|nr:biopolymer transporter ExbD [Rhodobacterales bacterium]